MKERARKMKGRKGREKSGNEAMEKKEGERK